MANNLRSELKLILRHSSVYGLANVLGQVISFLLLPLYTRYLTPADYGALEILYFVSTIVGIMVGMGVTDAMARFYFDSEERERRNQVVSTTVIGIGAIYALMSAILILLSPYFAELLLDSRDYTIHFQVLFLTLVAQFATSVATTYLRIEKRSFTMLILSLVQMLVVIGLNIWFIVYLEWGSLGMLTASLLSHGLLGAALLYLILRRTGLRFNRKLYGEMVRFGLPLIPSSLGSYVAMSSDRYFVKEYVSLANTGLYSLGYKVGSIFHSFLTSPFIQIWVPRRYESFGKDNSEDIFARIYSYFLAVLMFAALGVSLFARDILKIMTTEPFWSAYQIVPIIALAHVVHALYYHFSTAIAYKKQTKYTAYLNVTVGILNLCLNFVLIKMYGVWGAAIATLITYMARSALVYYFANRLVPIRFEAGKAIKILVSALIVFIIGTLVASDSLMLDIGIQTAVLMLYPALLYMTGFISIQEIKSAKEILQRLTRRDGPSGSGDIGTPKSDVTDLEESI